MYDNYIPGWIFSFSQLDEIENNQELREEYYDLLLQYTQLAANILENASYSPPTSNDVFNGYESFYVVDLINTLTSEFLQKLKSLEIPKMLQKEKVSNLSKGDVIYWAFLDDKGEVTDNGVGQIFSIETSGKHGGFEATVENPAYQIDVLVGTDNDTVYKRKGEKVWKRAGQIRKVKKEVTIKKENKNFFLTKDKNNNLIWYGIVTNNYQDDDEDVIKESAHKKFVEKVTKEIVPYPELWIWHLEKTVGDTRFIKLKDGFIMAAGTIFKEYENLVTNLVENTEDMRMSHGMPIDTVKYDSEGFIEEYISKEYTLLPGEFASNKLTLYGVDKNG